MESALEDEVGAVLRLEVLLHVLEVVLPGRAPPLGRHEVESGPRHAIGLVGLEGTRIHHAENDGGPPPDGRARMFEGRVGRGRLGQPREQRALRGRELAHPFAEEGSRGRLHPEGAVAEVDLVQVHLEDAVLRIAALELDGEHRFLELAVETSIGGEEEHLGELLRDGAAALHDAAAPEVLIHGARDTHGIDAEVGVEACVLGGNHGLLEGRRHLGERDEDAALDVELGDLLVVFVVDLGAHARLEALQLGDGGQGAGENAEHPEGGDAGGEHAHREHDHERHDDPAQPAAGTLGGAGGLFPSRLASHGLLLYAREPDQPLDRRTDGAHTPRSRRHRGRGGAAGQARALASHGKPPQGQAGARPNRSGSPPRAHRRAAEAARFPGARPSGRHHHRRLHGNDRRSYGTLGDAQAAHLGRNPRQCRDV